MRFNGFDLTFLTNRNIHANILLILDNEDHPIKIALYDWNCWQSMILAISESARPQQPSPSTERDPPILLHPMVGHRDRTATRVRPIKVYNLLRQTTSLQN